MTATSPNVCKLPAVLNFELLVRIIFEDTVIDPYDGYIRMAIHRIIIEAADSSLWVSCATHPDGWCHLMSELSIHILTGMATIKVVVVRCGPKVVPQLRATLTRFGLAVGSAIIYFRSGHQIMVYWGLLAILLLAWGNSPGYRRGHELIFRLRTLRAVHNRE